MIEYLTCIIKDNMTDTEIFEAIFNTPAYYVIDARLSPDRPLDVIYNEQKQQHLYRGLAKTVPTNRSRPKPIKI